MPKLTEQAHTHGNHELCFELPADIYEQLEKDAAARGMSVRQFVEQTLRAAGFYPTAVNVD